VLYVKENDPLRKEGVELKPFDKDKKL